MSGFISANPDDDFISDREDQWRKYAKGMEAFRDKQAATISHLQSELDRCREALKIVEADRDRYRFSPQGDNHHNALVCPYCNPHGLKFEVRAALGGSNDKG